MHVFAFPGQKGGSGKSTMCLNLSVELAQRGYRVVILDADPQSSLCDWYEAAQAHEESNPDYLYPTVVSVGENLKKTLDSFEPAFDVAMIDLPGRDAKVQRQALMAAHTALLVVIPGSFDVWSLNHTLEYVKQAQELREERDELLGTHNPLHATFLRNRYVVQQNLSRKVSEILEESGEPVMESTISSRIAFAEVPAEGIGITLYSDKKAAEEMRALTDEIERSFLKSASTTTIQSPAA
jgi:chromosome partitioning protein